jgi:pimeloyl-ACP methyl ester carboxylesterase
LKYASIEEIFSMNEPASASSGYAPVQGGELYYEMAGEGCTLLLIHAGVADCRMWDDQFTAFSQGFRTIRYDARGYGRSRDEGVPFSDRQDVIDLLDHLDVEKAILLGVSKGGMIALDFTLEHPGRVEALIAASSGLGGFEHQPDGSPKSQTETEMFARMQELWDKGELDALNELEARMWVDGPGQPPGRADASVRERVLRMNLEALERQSGEQPSQPLEPPAAQRLGEIRAPTLVIVGDLDTTHCLAVAEVLDKGIPGARKVVFPGTAHMLNMEQPEKFNRVVQEFLDAV